MELYPTEDGTYDIRLSERNVETLLFKLDEPESQKTIARTILHKQRFLCELVTTATEDDTHISEKGGVTWVYLSREALGHLLARKDVFIPTDYEYSKHIIRCESNDLHYGEREAGRMHPREEGRISRPASGVEWA